MHVAREARREAHTTGLPLGPFLLIYRKTQCELLLDVSVEEFQLLGRLFCGYDAWIQSADGVRPEFGHDRISINRRVDGALRRLP